MISFPMMKPAARALLLFVAMPLLFAGCTMKHRSQELDGLDLWNRDRTMPREVWNARYATDKDLQDARQLIVPFPFQLYAKHLHVSTDEAVARRTSWNDVGVPFVLMLPLRISYQEHLYEAGRSSSSATQRFSWNPLWARSSSTGVANKSTEIDAYGVPLIFSRVKAQRHDEERPLQFRLLTSLWTLGPATARWESGPHGDRGYMFAPLLLGGIIGTTVWSDFEARRFYDDGTLQQKSGYHGPLYGALGYIHEQRPPVRNEAGDEITVSRCMWLLGTIWSHRAERNEAGETLDSHNGPLWGMLGWGKKDGRNAVRLFWIPVKL